MRAYFDRWFMHVSRRDVMGGMALACLSGSAGAAPAVDPAEWLRRWLAAFNDADLSVYAAFVRRNIPDLVPYLDEDLGVREASGGFVAMRDGGTAGREITAWVRDRDWDRFSKVVLSTGERGIEDLSFAGSPDPVDFAVARTSERGALEALDRKLRAHARAGRFSGTVLVAREDRVLLREAYGARDAVGTPVMPMTRFCVGSAGKMFTAVAVLQLVQQGRLRLNDTIARLLPDYPHTALARQVTVEHLLTHSGGTGDFFGPDYEAHAGELRTPSDFVRMFGARAPLFSPGSRWGYSNFGFILLGAVLEAVSGETWDVLLKRRIFDVAGMERTSAVASTGDTALPLSGAAQTGLKPLPYYPGLPAGGGYSTVDDLFLFATALREGALLDPTHLHLLTDPKVAAGSVHWSLGLRIATRNGATSYGHRGSAPGVNADFAVYPRSGYTVVVLANRGHPHALNAAEFVGLRLPSA
jgi:D-alanyl-D-alanine carboxypeptidase